MKRRKKKTEKISKRNSPLAICDLIQSLKRNTLWRWEKLNCWNSAHLRCSWPPPSRLYASFSFHISSLQISCFHLFREIKKADATLHASQHLHTPRATPYHRGRRRRTKKEITKKSRKISATTIFTWKWLSFYSISSFGAWCAFVFCATEKKTTTRFEFTAMKIYECKSSKIMLPREWFSESASIFNNWLCDCECWVDGKKMVSFK